MAGPLPGSGPGGLGRCVLASTRPTVSPRAIAPAKALAIVELRRKRLTQARIAQAWAVSASTVSRVLARAGLSHLADWRAWCATSIRPPAICCTSTSRSWDVPPWHRVTGNRRDTVEGPAGTSSSCYDHARVAFTDIPPTSASPAPSVPQGPAYYQRLGVTIQRLLTDNGSAFRTACAACRAVP
ncbi:hypothetical protein L548_1365 [Bordetella pertussis H921]|nr:hypothetical protein L548_1365 [Bordetella pertussis H921]